MWEKQRIMGKSGAKEELGMDLEEEAAQKAEMHLGTIKAETHRDISPSSSPPSCPPPWSWRRITPPPSTPVDKPCYICTKCWRYPALHYALCDHCEADM